LTIKSRNIDRNSGVNKYRIQLGGTAKLSSATAAADTQPFVIMENSRLVEYVLGAKNKGAADTGGLNVALYLGLTATTTMLLTSATARLDSGTTGTLTTQTLATSLVIGPDGGMVVSAGSVLMLDVVEASASHSVGIIYGSLLFELDS
jgi:hypothetical protein